MYIYKSVSWVVLRAQAASDSASVSQVGIGLQDVSIARLVLQKAEKLQLGIQVPDYDS